jgi:hypothetical protein
MIGFLGTWDTYKPVKAVTKSFSLLELIFCTKLLQGRLLMLSSVQVDAKAQAIK